MNFASWVILGIVVLIVALAIRVTFFKKGGKAGCCDKGDEALDVSSLGCGSCSCSGCPSASSCHVNR